MLPSSPVAAARGPQRRCETKTEFLGEVYWSVLQVPGKSYARLTAEEPKTSQDSQSGKFPALLVFVSVFGVEQI